MTAEDCGGCRDEGSHRRHCRQNPDYSRELELADMAENLGDMIGPNNMSAANACYRAAGLLRVDAMSK